MPAPGSNSPNFGPRKSKPEVRRAEDLTGRPVIKSNPIHRATMKFVLKKILPFLINWKTSLAGIALIGHGIGMVADHLHGATEGNPITLEGMQLAIGEIIAGVGLIAARDANKSSQDSTIR
jgi:hypothetical protein